MDDLDFPGWEPAKSVQVVEGNGLTQVLVKGQPYMRWQSGDEGCTRLAIVQLYKCGLGTEEDLAAAFGRSEEHTSELQSQSNLVCRLLLEKKKKHNTERSPAHAYGLCT